MINDVVENHTPNPNMKNHIAYTQPYRSLKHQAIMCVAILNVSKNDKVRHYNGIMPDCEWDQFAEASKAPETERRLDSPLRSSKANWEISPEIQKLPYTC